MFILTFFKFHCIVTLANRMNKSYLINIYIGLKGATSNPDLTLINRKSFLLAINILVSKN